MEKHRSWIGAGHRVIGPVAATALAGCVLLAACSGIEADVLSLRPVPDLAAAASDGPPPDHGSDPRCTPQSISTMSCVEVPIWVMKAQAICGSLGLPVLDRVELQDPCGMGKSQGVRFGCCALPPVPVCTPRLQGDGMSCRDANTWLDSATVDCQARGEQVRMLALSDPCSASGFRLVRYMCCTPGGPPPPPMLP